MLFWGLLTIPNWYMDWVLTNAQFELLISDQPIISYRRQKGKGNHSKKEMDDMMAKWKAKREEQGKGTDFKVGEKINLNDFLRTGMDAFNTKKK